MSELTVTTIIPTYNRAHLVGRAIESALTASSERDEIIVVDDGSTDNTSDILASFGKRIRQIRITNSGAGKARNVGISKARNDLVAFLDSDDEWMPDKLNLQRRLMQERQDILFSFTNFSATDEKGCTYHNNVVNWSGDNRPWSEILGEGQFISSVIDIPDQVEDCMFYTGSMYKNELETNYIFTSTLVVRRETAGDSLCYAEDLPLYEDWFCFGLLARKGRAAFIDCETACQYANAVTRLTHADKLKMSQARVAVIELVWGCDEEFMCANQETYDSVLSQQRLDHVKNLVLAGKYDLARNESGKLDDCPGSIRRLLSLPDWGIKTLIKLRTLLRGGY